MRFYLHVHEVGKSVAVDPEGTEHPSLDLARAEAIEAAQQLAAERARAGVTPLGGFIEIADADDKVLLVVRFADAFRASR